MTSFLRSDRSRPVAVWLFCVAFLVLSMIVVGGATRLTDSGLSITEWKPVTGAIPPLSAADWNAEFAKYREIPQYKLLNKGMSLQEFQFIYWWEWSHRFLGRLVGAAYALPLLWFAVRREIPRRLTWPLVGLFALGGLQGAVGWWMVASGLSERVSVAPERLMTHLGLAFILLAALVWTALEAWSGQARQGLAGPWRRASLALIGLIYFQILLGALVAGNDAGLVYRDWPLMNGAFFPDGYHAGSVWMTLAHNQASVQFNHRIVAYILTLCALVSAVAAWKSGYLPRGARQLGVLVGVAVTLQAGLGVATLMMGVPLIMGVLHQVAAAFVLAIAVAFAWRVRRV